VHTRQSRRRPAGKTVGFLIRSGMGGPDERIHLPTRTERCRASLTCMMRARRRPTIRRSRKERDEMIKIKSERNVPSVEEGHWALVASLKSFRHEAGDVRVKRRPLRRGQSIAPIRPSPPLLPDLPSPSLRAQGGDGVGNDAQPVCRSTADPTATQRPGRSVLGSPVCIWPHASTHAAIFLKA
jgi:hypothetical protein